MSLFWGMWLVTSALVTGPTCMCISESLSRLRIINNKRGRHGVGRVVSWGQGVVDEYSQNILDKCIQLSTDE